MGAGIVVVVVVVDVVVVDVVVVVGFGGAPSPGLELPFGLFVPFLGFPTRFVARLE